LRLAVLLGLACLATGEDDDSLAGWFEARGGELGGVVRRSSAGVRGLFAPRDYKHRELVAHLPFDATVPLPTLPDGSLAMAELAQLVFDPASKYAWNGSSFAPFWASQPQLSELFTWDFVPPDALELLDELPLLRNAAAAQMQSHRAEHAALVASLAARGAAYSVSFEEFVRLAMLVFSRSFCLRRETGEGGCENLLLPGFDMCNTAEQATATRNAAAADGALPRRVEMRAMGDVRAGDEFVIRYFNTATPRNDVRFLKYGIVVDDDLRLLAVDTRVGGAAAADGRPLPSALERHVLRGEDPPAAKMGLEEAKREIRRLEAILAPLAPVEADRQALARAADAWAPASMALRLRIVRKAALRRRLDALQARLEGVLDSRSGPPRWAPGTAQGTVTAVVPRTRLPSAGVAEG